MPEERNPYTLFLILILLVLGTDPQAVGKIDVIKGIVEKMSNGITGVRNSFEAMAASLEESKVKLIELNSIK